MAMIFIFLFGYFNKRQCSQKISLFLIKLTLLKVGVQQVFLQLIQHVLNDLYLFFFLLLV